MNKNLIIFFEGHCRQKSLEIRSQLNALLEDFNHVDFLFYRDTSYNWYLNDIDSFIKKIKDATEGYTKITFIGRSAGGYIAILIGSLLDVGNVITFCAQTFVNHLPMRVQKLSNHKNFINLKNIINKNTNFYVNTEKGNNPKHGFQHYENIKHFKNVNFIDENFQKMLKNDHLKEMLKKINE